MTDFAEFRLRIEPGPTPTTYRIDASGPGGDRSAAFELPFTDEQLENFILKVGRTRRGVRRIESPEMELARTFGGKLFAAVMAGGVGEAYRAAERRGARAQAGPSRHALDDAGAEARDDPVGVPLRRSRLPLDVVADARRPLPWTS